MMGNPAFPVVELDQKSGHVFAQHMGMTLRQYYAGQALAGMSADAIRFNYPSSLVIKSCVSLADDLIAELEKTS